MRSNVFPKGMTAASSQLRHATFRSMQRDRNAWLGSAAVAVLVVAVTIVLVVSSLNVGQRSVEADFAQAAQLEAGDRVTVAGVSAGHVVGIRLAGNHVVVTMSLADDIELGADTSASIKLTTLLGSRYVDLVPAGSGSLPGGRVPLAHTSVPYDLQSALAGATTTFDQVDADKVGDALTKLSSQLGGLPQLITPVMQNIRTLSVVIANRRGQIGSLLTTTSRLTTVIRDQQANLGVLFTQGRDLLQEIQARRHSIELMISATSAVVRELKPIAVDDRSQVQGLLDNLNAMLGMLSRHDDLLRNVLQILPVPWRTWANLTGSGPELDANVPAGAFVDSFMCALSARSAQADLPPYFKDCK